VEDISDLLSKLIESTANDRIRWEALPSISTLVNPSLVEYLERDTSVPQGERFGKPMRVMVKPDPFDSFRYGYGEGSFLLIAKYADDRQMRYFYLCTQRTLESEVLELHTHDDFQADLVRLHLLVRRQVRGVDQYIHGFLRDPST
jgi:hypothetical protein